MKYKFNGKIYKDRGALGEALHRTCGIERHCKFYNHKLNECVFEINLNDDINECKCINPDKMFS